MSAEAAVFEFPDDRPIIVVDDDPGERHILRYVLGESQLRNEVVLFGSAAALLEYMDSVAAGEAAHPALILMDINMPGQSGFEALAKLRTYPEFAESPRIVIVTSSDATEDQARSVALGANGYLAKQSGIDAYTEMLDARLRNCSQA